MHNNSINFIENRDSELVISHRIIAEQVFEFDERKKGSREQQLKNKMTQVKELILDNRTDFEDFGNLRFETEGLERTTESGQSRGIVKDYTIFLNEAQATLLITYLRNNQIVRAFKKELVKQFFQMKEILQNSQPKLSEKYEKVQTELLGLEFSFKHFKVNEASKILMTETLYKDLGVNTNYFPKYSDENHSVSLSSLLKKFNGGISANKFNKLLIEKEFLEILTRKSSKTEENEKGEKTPIYKEFKSITKKGEEFGTNKVSTQNQLQTQPHYFENKFEELLEIVKIQKTLF